MREDLYPLEKLGNLCQFVRGPFGGALKKNIFKKEGYAVYEQQHAIYNQFDSIRYFIDQKKFNEMVRFELKPGDLIMSCSGTMGKTAIVPEGIERGIINQALLKLTPFDNLDVEYLNYWMKSDGFDESLNKNSSGVAIKNVASVKHLKEIPIPIPPLSEQKQIVAILDKAFEAIDQAKANIERNIENANELFQSKLNDVFSQKGEGWEEKRLGDVCKTGAGGTPLKAKTEYYDGGKIPWILSGEVKRGEIYHSDNFINEKGLANSSAKLFPANTVLVAMYGATAGDVGILRFESATNQAVCGIYPCKEYLPEFIYYSMLVKRDELISKAVGNAQPNISQIKIKDSVIPFIAIDKQNQIVKELRLMKDSMERLIEVFQNKILELDDLKKSILQKAYSGELTKNEIPA